MVNVYLFGASGHGKVVKDILNANGVKVEAFVDDNPRVDECSGRKVLHDATGLSPMIVSIGVNKIRRIVVDGLVAKANAEGHPLKFTYDIHYNQNFMINRYLTRLGSGKTRVEICLTNTLAAERRMSHAA